MSPVGRALRTRFEEVCRNELQRLRRKTASLAPEHREQVDAISVEVAKGIASRLDAAIETAGTDDVASVVMRLFAVTEPTLEERS
jgi:glutamyl-tRNA reductase